MRSSLWVLVVLVQLFAFQLVANATDQPNVIVVMTDDQGYGDLSCHGNTSIKTPNLDKLHGQSVRFTDFHVAPYCTPTRAALMTGRYPGRTGAYRTSAGRSYLHSREKTLGDLFTTNGYATGMFGKWHLGDTAPSRPMDCGFEKSVWHRCGGLTQISDYWTNDYFDDTYLVGDQWKKFDGYCTDVWFDEAMSFITANANDAGGKKPFFVYLAPNAPHGPYLVADQWKKPYLDAGDPKSTAAFKGMVANFDWNMGRLFEYLEKEKLVDNTLLIFMTDNGTSAGCAFGKGGRIYGWPVKPEENGNRRGGKSSAYDGGHRVPLFVRWPNGSLGEARDVDTLAAHFDLTPTLIDLCGIKRPENWPKLDGRSLTPLLRNEPAAVKWEPRVLHTQMHGGNGFVKPNDPWEIGAAITKRWRLVEGRELYDISVDPLQRNDVAKKFPDVVADLDRQHLQWFESVRPGMDPTRMLIGSEFESPTDLTSQDWALAKGNPPWAHSHVVRRKMSNGVWKLDVTKPGSYRFKLSRWPLYIDKPIDSTAAKIQIAGQTFEAKIESPDETTFASFDITLPAGPAELQTWLTAPGGKTHGAYFVSVERESSAPVVLWTQYCLTGRDTAGGSVLKLSVHTDLNPLKPVAADVELHLKDANDQWQKYSAQQIESLTAMATFRIADWDNSKPIAYKVTSGTSSFEGTFRAEPNRDTLKLMAIACVNDKWFPYSEVISQMVAQDPDVIYFAGDQIYESNAGGEVVMAETKEQVPAGMANYLAKWRKFGLTFKDLLKDRPSLILTDDHDVYANDLWGDGGRRMKGDRTTGGYPTDVAWVNAVEKTQTWHMPDAAAPGPWGDGVYAYFTSLTYGGVEFAILEDRKFKSPPSEVLSKAIEDPESTKPNRTLEVIMDPAFDVKKLDRDDLQLLGSVQEEFVRKWAAGVAKQKRLAAVLTQSPFVNIGNYDVRYGDMDANGWPQTARNRALTAIAPAQPIMIHGDIHFGTLHQHGIKDWGDGPWAYSLPAFASKQNRSWGPSAPAQGGELPGIAGSGNHHDRFGNKLTVAGTAPGDNGYGIIVFDSNKKTIRCELHTMDADRKPNQKTVPGWPLTIPVKH